MLKKGRKIKLIEQQINCVDEPMIEEDYINFTWEMWFDVDAYFGTNTKNDSEAWINFYTNWSRRTNKIRAFFVYSSNNKQEEYNWTLTKEEEKFLRAKMEEYVGGSLQAFYDNEMGDDNIFAVPYSYAEFKSINDSYPIKIGRILDVDFRKNNCILKVEDRGTTIDISHLVYDIARDGMGAVSNPSAIAPWKGFRNN